MDESAGRKVEFVHTAQHPQAIGTAYQLLRLSFGYALGIGEALEGIPL